MASSLGGGIIVQSQILCCIVRSFVINTGTSCNYKIITLFLMKRGFVPSYLCIILVCVRCFEMICSIVLRQLRVLIVQSCLLAILVQRIVQVGFRIKRQCECSSVVVAYQTCNCEVTSSMSSTAL